MLSPLSVDKKHSGLFVVSHSGANLSENPRVSRIKSGPRSQIALRENPDDSSLRYRYCQLHPRVSVLCSECNNTLSAFAPETKH